MKKKNHVYFYLIGCGLISSYFTYLLLPYFKSTKYSFSCEEKTTEHGAFEHVVKFLSENRAKNQVMVDSCDQLLNDGHLKCLKKTSMPRLLKIGLCSIRKSVWQPRGCNLQTYNTSTLAECMRNIPSIIAENEILMLGDSRVRHLYITLKSKLQNKKVHGFDNKIIKEKYEDSNTGLTLNYVYRPLTDDTTIGHLREIIKSKQSPVLLLIGNALHGIMHSKGSLEGLISYRKNFTQMGPLLEILTKKTTVIWMMQSPLVKEHSGISNLMIQLYNNVAEELLNGSHVHMMRSARSIGIATLGDYLDGTHLGILADKMIVEVMLNYLCNKNVAMQDKNVCCQK